MTLKQFELHRVGLYRQLMEMIEDASPEALSRWEIHPRYENEIRFEAWMDGVHLLTCVSPNHPMSMVDEESPGCQGTWWWVDDLIQDQDIGSI